MPENGIYRFGMFELDSRARELKKHGVRIKLQDQPLRILLMLVQHPGEVVTREQIQSELWPAGTYVDYENAINSSVRKLREALGDSPTNPRFIETLSRRGYRLLVPVSRDGQALGPEELRFAVRRRRWPVFAAAGVLVVAMIVGVLFGRRRSSGELVLPPALPLTNYPGQVCCPSISPDGTRVAFSWNGPNSDNFDIYVKLIGQGEPVRLTQDPARDWRPAWSPDARWIAFTRFAAGRESVLVIPAMGGPEREVTKITPVRFPGVGSWSLSWSHDGKSLFAVDRSPGSGAAWITRVSVDSGEKEKITFPPSGTYGDSAPAVSPEGGRLAFTRTASLGVDQVYVLSLEIPPPAQAPTRVTAEQKRVEGLAWTPEGRELVFSAARGGGSALWQVPADGRSRPVLLTGGGDNGHELAISANRRLIYSTSVAAPHLWSVPIGGDSEGPGAPFLRSTRADEGPHYSPDGRRVAFESNRSGHDEIWVCNADGTALVQVTSLAAWSGTPHWSPDADKIAFDSNSSGNWDIFVVGSHGGRPVQLTRNPADDYIPSWSQDGKWIYFSSARTPRAEIWKIPSAGGREIQVTRNGGFQALEAPSGKELYFTKSSLEGSLWRMALPDGEEEEVAGPIFGRDFAPASRGVYLIQRTSNPATLRFFQYGSRSDRVVASLGSAHVADITISPDERSALYMRFDVTNSELMLVEGFGRKHGP